MEDNPFISVMILCYNYAELLKKALAACVSQTYKDFEIVMINNGSTDETEKVYRTFCLNHPDIRTTYVPVYPNEGPIHGWNVGIQHANGEYILFNDADDWMEPDCLERLAEKAQSTGSDRVTGQYQEADNKREITRVRYFSRDPIDLPSAMLQATLFRKSVINDNQLVIPENPYVPAYDWWFVFNFACCEKKKSEQVYGKPIYNYYINPISEVTKSQKHMDWNDDLKKWDYPVISIASDAQKRTTKAELKSQMEYLVIRHYYSSILYHYCKYNKKDASDFYNSLHEHIVIAFPNYLNNPYLKAFHSHYSQPSSFFCWILKLTEKMHCMPFIYRLVRAFPTKKLLNIR